MSEERFSNTGKDSGSGNTFRLSDFSIRYPVTICMVLVSFLVLGGVSLFKIPLILLPEVSAPFIGVRVPYFNATPEQIQETITKPLEEALSTLPKLERITSESSSDNAFISLYFGWGQDVDWLRSEIREKVEQVRPELPPDVQHIYVQTWNTSEIPIIEGRIASGRDLRGQYDFLDLKIKKPLERVPGVADVRITGVERKEISIYLRLDDIKRYRVDVDSLFRRLDSVNRNLSLGRINEGGVRYGVLSRGTLDSLEAMRKFPISERGLVLSDIADVEFRDPAINYGRHLNGEYAISLEIRKSSEANTVETVDRVMETIRELNEDPSLHGIEVLVWHNAGAEIRNSLSGLLNAGTVGALLSVLVLFLFLGRLGATLAIGISIPFSIVSAVGFLYLAGNTLNVLSMMGLMLSTGMLVDNAVVVLESIFQQLEKGYERVTAARIGTREVLMAVTASTLTSIIIFVPLVFGKQTQYSIWLGHSGAAIMITLLCSLFVSLTLIPLGVARLLRLDSDPLPRGPWSARMHALGNRFRRLVFRQDPNAIPFSRSKTVERYLAVVAWNLRHRYLMGFLVVPVIVGVSFYVMTKLPDNTPQAEDLRDLAIQYEFSENYHYAIIEQLYVEPVETYLLSNRGRFKIDNIYSFYGNNFASTRIYFDEKRITLDDLNQIRKDIAAGLPVVPGAEISLGRQEGASNENWIGLNIYGEDTIKLQELAAEARKRLRQNSNFQEVYTALDRGNEEVQVVLNRELATKYGVSPQSVAGILDIVLRGRQLSGYRSSEGEVDIWVKLQPGDREDLEDLKSMIVGGGSDGREILLSHVAQLEIAKTPGSIQRENRQTYTQIFANYTGDKREEGRKLVSEILDAMVFPPGYGWSYGFWTQMQQREDRDFMFNILLALFMVYFVMASLFESLAHPFSIMLSLLFAFVGVTWFLLLTGTPFNLMAMIGMMVLIGIVVNNGIVLLDHVNNLRRKGSPRSQAILEGCRERFRPILMTAATTVVGLIPLAVGTSSMFGMRYFPMARTVMGGLMASTILTLIILPVYYTLLDDLAVWLRRVWFASAPTTAPAAEPLTPGTTRRAMTEIEAG